MENMKKERCDEFIARDILNKYCTLGHFEKLESPDLQSEDYGIDVTHGWGQKYDIQENVKKPKIFKENPNCIIIEPSTEINAETFEKELVHVLNAIDRKKYMRYGFKKNGLYIFSRLPCDERWLQAACDKISKSANKIYDKIIVHCRTDAKLLIIDVNNKHFEIINLTSWNR